MNSSRSELARAHEKIAQLEARLLRLKRAFDPEPLANPISEEQHHELLSRSTRRGSVMGGSLGAILWTLCALGVVLFMATVVYFAMTAAPLPSAARASAPRATSTSP